MATNTVSMPEDLDFKLIFEDGEYDEEATMASVALVIRDYRKELAQDSEAIKGHVDAVFLAHGQGNVPVSTMPKDMLVAELHERLGSKASTKLWKRNTAKLAANLPDYVISGGKSGARRASPDEIAARRVVKAANKLARKAKKDAEKARIAELLAADDARKANAPPVVRV